ncbi:LysR family transcriptional regulator ArgP [Roseinatronobacter bogoriensis]|uniref:LysR family transcriptional regulator ArgP n=1 Tax=Roseinatronobacter bogoriensis subsp. barguzinensis TaxID=441209 RepID=A0A2K8K6M5_9RHOB|nr:MULTISPECIES: LysR family transcriptional regulator ArgP [Rhodobaca]ATX65079.1 LysR family transcriptional regulator ArgP [Rhodobaca barguzinensis]MBB4209560.1 LysR family transcriptional regulator (chromosome initiation inhibitor) [Rhodobaca bogoriensis DSM 18756]TDW35448.1 LysR family transcriptional regulator (chromosome initiation inhibitor) [Rhodobaca barguzinensis]TDY66659.1 LysR family transcriptional regulator (chromosome initiation inhibitor) [Rhodobaca bogoriensis DSM 18756]
MLDYPAARAVAMVVQTGSFEGAARALGVTPSAISQRVRALEERLGTVLIERASPCRATAAGDALCRHIELVGLAERDLMAQLPASAYQTDRVTLSVAVNSDSLATWVLPALAGFARDADILLDIAVDDEDHTTDWLKSGRVVAALTAVAKPVQGCKSIALGSLRYHATASPGFVQRFFSDGVTLSALARAPALTFNQKDQLQNAWMQAVFGQRLAPPTHWLPSTQGFVTAAVQGVGWGMNPASLVQDHLRSGRLVELIADTPFDRPLFWQINRRAAEPLRALSDALRRHAREALV